MASHVKCYQLKEQAKDQLRGNYKTSMLVSLLNIFLPGLITLIADYFTSPFIPSINLQDGFSVMNLLPYYSVTTFFSFIISSFIGIFALGNSLYYLKVACNRPRGVNDLFYGFRQDTQKALSVSCLKVLLNLICTVPARFCMQCYLLSGINNWLYRALLAMAIGYCIFIPIALSMELAYYLMLDFPGKSAKEVLLLSFKIMHGQKARLFYIECSFIPLLLLGVCSLYIGFLWIIPYMQMTLVLFFLDVMKSND